jgi:lycopene beta-cyclase
MTPLDVLVLGAGPAGTLLASELARRGLAVGLLCPVHPAPWPNTYGAWEDDLPGEVRQVAVASRWESASVRTVGGLQALPRAYVRIDNARLQAWAHARADVTRLTGEAADVAQVEGGLLQLRTVGGAVHTARLVVDATGGRSPFARWQKGPAPGVQTAYGVVAEVEGEPLEGHACVLMDYGAAHVEDAWQKQVPSFLYGMHLGGSRYFLEETVLVARPPFPVELLEARLHQRLAARGARLGQVEEVERVHIPMGGALPRREGLVVGFGAAARMEHPATGYMLTRVLRVAPRVAEAVAAALPQGPAAAREAAWEAVWPAGERRARALWTFGMEVLLGLDAEATRRFFASFFQLPGPDWRGYMSGTLDARALRGVMWRLFQRVPPSLSVRLAAAGMGGRGLRLASQLLSR